MTDGGRDAFAVFGTTGVLLVTDAAALRPARDIADAELAAVDLAASRFRDDSELTALNGAAGAVCRVSPLFASLIAAALRAAMLTDGAVDPTCAVALASLGYDRDFGEVRRSATAGAGTAGTGTAGTGTAGTGTAVADRAGAGGPVPGWRSVELDEAAGRVRLRGGAQLDLGATAKAWAADRCAALIAGRLGCGVLVSLGGDIAVAGPPPDGGWRIRVQDVTGRPEDPPDGPSAVVAIRDGGLATSSTTARRWRRGGTALHHILDPRTGLPAPVYWRTVSVAAASCADANTASTAAIIRGERALGWLVNLGLPARLVDAAGNVQTVAGWPAE